LPSLTTDKQKALLRIPFTAKGLRTGLSRVRPAAGMQSANDGDTSENLSSTLMLVLGAGVHIESSIDQHR